MNRLYSALTADFVIGIYNPSSSKRKKFFLVALEKIKKNASAPTVTCFLNFFDVFVDPAQVDDRAPLAILLGHGVDAAQDQVGPLALCYRVHFQHACHLLVQHDLFLCAQLLLLALAGPRHTQPRNLHAVASPLARLRRELSPSPPPPPKTGAGGSLRSRRL